MTTIKSPTLVKAKKEHRCDWCEQTVKSGEKYFYAYYKYDSISYSWKSHKSCMGLIGKLNMIERCDDYGVSTEDFYEFVNQEFDLIVDENFEEKVSFIEKLRGVFELHNIEYTQ